MKKVIICSTTVLILSLFSLGVAAANPSPGKYKPEKQSMTNIKKEENLSSQKAEFRVLKRGDSFLSEKETYQFLPELYSVLVNRNSSTSNSNKAASIQSELSATLVGKKGRFSIYKSGLNTESINMAFQTQQSEILYPVVINDRTGNLGIVTGMIVVKIEDIGQADDIASDFDLTLKKAYPHISSVFYTVSPGQDIILLNEELKNDPRVENSNIEVLEHLQTAQ